MSASANTTRSAELSATLERIRRRLLDKGLLAQAGDAVSVLVPESSTMLYQAHDAPHARELPLDTTGPAALHAQVYRLRADAGAIATLHSATASALARANVRLPIVFDEQARHLGKAWRPAAGRQLAAALGDGANAGLVDDTLVVIGVTPNRVAYNAELFQKCAHAFLLACGGNGARRTHRIPWWVCLIAGRRLRKDQAHAAQCHVAGQDAPELTAY